MFDSSTTNVSLRIEYRTSTTSIDWRIRVRVGLVASCQVRTGHQRVSVVRQGRENEADADWKIVEGVVCEPTRPPL